MAQADEMGEDGEREKDDGFVDGADNVRRRIKKKPSELKIMFCVLMLIVESNSGLVSMFHEDL